MANMSEELALPLRRQRRFLVLVSLGVIVYFVFGIDFDTKAEYSGLSLRIRDPRFALPGLWAVWGWALLRYLQCAYQALSRVWGEILEDVEAETTRIAANRVGRIVKKQVRAGEGVEVPRDSRLLERPVFGELSAETMRAHKVMGQPFTQTYVPDMIGGRAYLNVQSRFGKNVGGFLVAELVNSSITFTGKEMRWMRVRAWLYASIALPGVSEHLAPLGMALGALAAAALAHHSACFADWCLISV